MIEFLFNFKLEGHGEPRNKVWSLNPVNSYVTLQPTEILCLIVMGPHF